MKIIQTGGEGGEQGDPEAPLIFLLINIQNKLNGWEKLWRDFSSFCTSSDSPGSLQLLQCIRNLPLSPNLVQNTLYPLRDWYEETVWREEPHAFFFNRFFSLYLHRLPLSRIFCSLFGPRCPFQYIISVRLVSLLLTRVYLLHFYRFHKTSPFQVY